jgi:hypothetical protein
MTALQHVSLKSDPIAFNKNSLHGTQRHHRQGTKLKLGSGSKIEQSIGKNFNEFINKK